MFKKLFGKKSDTKKSEKENINASENANIQNKEIQNEKIENNNIPDKKIENEIISEEKKSLLTEVKEETNERITSETKPKKVSTFSKLKNSLRRTRENFSEKVAGLILGKKTIDNEILEEIETYLLLADVGIETTTKIIDNLTTLTKRRYLKDTEKLFSALKDQLKDIVLPCQKEMNIKKTNPNMPYVILMVGVNGSGKTTTIGKLAKKLQAQNKKVMLAAGDTFRAAAIEQLSMWGERNDVPVVAQKQGSDSASVIFDALQSAKAKNYDVLIADTAGRLHTKENLMNELKKVVKVIKKLDESAPHEIMLVLDATTGQNALLQAKKFHQAINLSSITITKLDGTAKGGILFAVANELNLPIRFIGIGEQIDDLRNFEAKPFVDALFS